MFSSARVVSPIWREGVGRKDKALLYSLGLDLDSQYFISGPREIIENVTNILLELRVSAEKLRYEFWW